MHKKRIATSPEGINARRADMERLLGTVYPSNRREEIYLAAQRLVKAIDGQNQPCHLRQKLGNIIAKGTENKKSGQLLAKVSAAKRAS